MKRKKTAWHLLFDFYQIQSHFPCSYTNRDQTKKILHVSIFTSMHLPSFFNCWVWDTCTYKDSRKTISHSSGTWHFKDFLIWAFANNNALYVEDGCFCSIQCKTYKNRVKMQVWSIDIKISSQQQKILNSTQPTLG